MKLSEEMDVDNGSIPAEATKITTSPLMTSDENAKLHLPMQNGTKYPAENVSNGNTFLDNSPEKISDEDAIGFEVESYSDFNSSLSHGSFSGNKGDIVGIELNGNKPSSYVGDNGSNCKNLSDESCAESTHNSSHMSEEFQLRLSDDDSSHPSESVTSSTPFKSPSDASKDEAESIFSGSEKNESTPLATDSSVENVSLHQEPNQDNESGVHQLAHELETPCSATEGEPKVPNDTEVENLIKPKSQGDEGVNEQTSLSTDLQSQTTKVQNESDKSTPSDKSSSQPENSAKLLSLEDTLEAELEAELQAEIAAEMENKDKVNAKEKTDSEFDKHSEIMLDEDSNIRSFNQEKCEVAGTGSNEKPTDLLETRELSNSIAETNNLVISVIKTEKEDEEVGDFLHIKEELSLKSEEMSLDSDDLPLKKEIKPLVLKSDGSHVKSEPFTFKIEDSTIKSEPFPLKTEDCPIKKEVNLGESETKTFKSESQNVCTKSSETSTEDDESVTLSESADKPLGEIEDSGVMNCQESTEVEKLQTMSCELVESDVNKENAGEAAEDQNLATANENSEDESMIPILSQQLETPSNINCHDEESRSHESDHPVTTDEESARTKNLDSNSASLSEPNSPFSDDSECPVSEFHAESDGISDNGEEILNENDSDTMCENDQITTDEAESNDKSGADGSKFPDLKKIASSDLQDMNLSESSNFCDSTVLDSSCTDNMIIEDSSNSANQSNVTKGFRKRFLSHSDDDSLDTFRNKKSNGLAETEESSKSKRDHHDSQKRPAEVTLDIDSKKLRISGEDLNKDPNNITQREEGQRPTENDKWQTPTAENLGDSTFESDKELENTGDAAANTLANLPFLRKLHKTEFSKMSRSDLEELILQKMCEAITERSVVGELRLRCQALENRQEKENEKFNKLKKQMTELSIVMRKYLDNQRLHKPGPPIKVTRSVGLQVCPAVKQCSPACFSTLRTRGCLPSAHPTNQNWPAKQTATPSKPDSSLPEMPVQTVQQSKQVTPNKVVNNRPPSYGPRPATNVVSSTVPPALVPTGTTSAAVLLMPARPVMTPPRVQVPPLQQISTTRPRFSIPTSTASTSPQPVVQVQQKPSPVRQGSPQSTSQPKAAGSTDVEVIDIESEDHSKRPAGLQISAQQHQHQQKQAANAAAQSLAGNSGMTVRLISPTQTISTGYSNFLQGGMPQKMIFASSPPGNGIRGPLKFVMKSNQGNVIIPLQNGTAVTSSVVQIPTSAAAVQQIFTNAGAGKRTNAPAPGRQISLVHPAPLPGGPISQAQNPAWKQIPPRPNLKIQHQNNGIVLSWNMALGSQYADIESYQLFAYQEGAAPPNPSLWKKVGDVKALPLPMACTLTQFVEGHKYHFTVRAVDKHGRVGPFSQQGSIRLGS